MSYGMKLTVDDGPCRAACHLYKHIPAKNNPDIYYIKDIKITSQIEKDEETGVVRQINCIENIGDNTVKVNRVSNVFIDEIAPNFHNKDVVIHLSNFCWQGEAQWVTRTPYEMGLYPVSEHETCRTGKAISGKGSWSTDTYYPILLIEDKTDNKCWFFEHEDSVPWGIELGIHGAPHKLELTVDVNTVNEYDGRLSLRLKSKESYQTSAVLYGAVDGGVDKAINALITYKRKNSKRFTEVPFCFNIYMNCLRESPFDEKLIPIIDMASDVGCEVFCIDAGWHDTKEKSGVRGTWVENNDIYPGGLKNLAKYIESKGMKLGLWLELETCTPGSLVYELSENSLLKRDGNVIEKDIAFTNFSDPAVKEHFREIISHLYSLGVRYIKNDYNHTLGSGCDNGDANYILGIHRNTKAFYDFIDEISASYPDLILENCASGAMRCDHGTLKRFHFQSMSDQDHYFNNPTVLHGMHKCIPPEKCLVWAFPYPLYHKDRLNFDTVMNEEHLMSFADGAETAYNMACILFGAPLLSGHIECADEYNKLLIKKAVDLYKSDNKFVASALPLDLYRQQRLYSNGYTVLALESDQKIRIGIFKYKADEPLRILADKLPDLTGIKDVYPAENGESLLRTDNGYLIFDSPKDIDAYVYEIKKNEK